MVQRHQLVLVEKVAEDAHTLLYRARRAPDQPLLLAKFLKSEYPDKKQIAKLQHEYDILTTPELDGVVKAIALDPFGHGQVLLIEDFDGQLLSEMIARSKLDLAKALGIATSVARSLLAAEST